MGRNLAFRRFVTVFSSQQKTRGAEAGRFSESACFPVYYGQKSCNVPLIKVIKSNVFAFECDLKCLDTCFDDYD